MAGVREEAFSLIEWSGEIESEDDLIYEEKTAI